jgi:predicted nucleic acid-binding protein
LIHLRSFVLLEDEPGAVLVEQKIAAAEAGNIKLGASFVSLTELFYITHLSQGTARAEEFVAVVKSWPMEIIFPDETLCLAAGEIKATQSVSLADAFVAAIAQLTSAVLIHKDPEFEPLKGRSLCRRCRTNPPSRGHHAFANPPAWSEA